MPEWANKNIEEQLVEAVDEYEEQYDRQHLSQNRTTDLPVLINVYLYFE